MQPTRADLHRLLLFIRDLIARIESVRTAITSTGKATVDAIADNTKAAEKAAKQQPSQPPSRITVDIQIPPEETSRYYAEQDKSYRLQRRTFWATFATFVAVAVYSGITYETLCEIRRQTASTAKAANAAASAAHTAEVGLMENGKALQLDQRAWLVVHETHLSRFAANNELIIDFLITNVGKTPARRVRFKRFFSWRLPTERDLGNLDEGNGGDPNLAPGEKRTQRFTVVPPITTDRFTQLTAGRGTFSVVGEFLYQDIFGIAERSTPTCVYFETRSMPLLSGCRVGDREMK